MGLVAGERVKLARSRGSAPGRAGRKPESRDGPPSHTGPGARATTWTGHRDRFARHGLLWAQDNLTYFRASSVDWL